MTNEKKFSSRKQMVYENFNRFVPMMPSLKQILQGIILAQIDQNSQLSKGVNLIGLIDIQTQMWKQIFSMAKSVNDFNEPLTHKTLSNPNHEFVKTLVYIYSMESFVFSEMNRASRMKDVSKIKFYGAFASALGYIVHCGNQRSSNLAKEFTVFRGLQLPSQDLQEKFKVGEKVNLQGFTSSTVSRQSGLGFALQDLTPEEDSATTPVLLEIKFSGRNQYFSLNSSDYSAFDKEEEVLLQEGIKYTVTSIEEEAVLCDIDGQECSKMLTIVRLSNIRDKYKRMNWCKRKLRYLTS